MSFPFLLGDYIVFQLLKVLNTFYHSNVYDKTLGNMYEGLDGVY